ncbi:hypothetical protein Vretimale_17127 [Volvox reticuliferus]|uniref:Kinetochore protein NDC80 n=2 Tax=Volvox reticuliferus TaxID=1737510 RepID=A0A8J4FXQ8_9CHLO|nr:hypothetical protein Vretifemale_18620 [Volvox reticuliferus]GIM14098.1 hypothetical protein Vretimale_17127 [Volvox reticuliferus]
MSRRQTLAQLSPSQLNSKGGNSGVPPRCSKDVGPLPGKGRKSVAGGLLMATAMPGSCLERRSSVVTKSSGPKQDPRPLNSKEYQNNCIKTVINYLTTHNFSYPVSPKTLASPTGKDFSAVVTFLFQQIDPVAFRILGKVEDEVPLFFKRLNYPFQISKSALFAVGTPHSWPAVLAALTWLVELLEYAEKSGSKKSSGFERENKVEDFLDYLAEGYQTWMSGDDDRCQQLDEQFAAKYIKQAAELDASREERCRAKEQLLAELAQFRLLPDPVETAKQKLKELLVDKDKLQQLVQQDQGLKQMALRKLSEKKADLQAKQDQIAASVAEVEQLRQRVVVQSVNKADLNRMIMERNKQAEVLAAETAKCEEMEQRVHEREMQIVRCLNGIDALAVTFGRLANRLKLIPATSKRAGGTNYELRINRNAASQVDFCNLDLKGVVKPNLERLCETYRTRASQLGQDLISLKEALMARSESSTEKQEENAVLQADIAKAEAQLQAAKDAQEEKCRRLTAQAEGIKAQVDEFYSAVSNRTEHMEEQLSRAQLIYEQTKRECESELAKLEADLNQAIKLMIAHKEFVTNTIARTATVIRQAKGEIADLHKARIFNVAAT